MSKFHDPADDFDGIKEEDNPLPNWWVLTFIGTVIFAVIYYGYYELGPGPTLMEEFQAEKSVVEAKAEQNAPNKEDLLNAYASAMEDSERLASGGSVFVARCAACHGQKGEGLIGPNLTDYHWIHGAGKLEDIAEVVIKGVPAKGMVPWGDVLSRDELVNVVAFVKSLEGQMIPGKAAEGQSAR